MKTGRPNAAGADPRLADAARALEAMFLKQIVASSGAFRGGEGPGAGIRADQFAEALADAVSRNGGGIGVAAEITRSLGPGDAAPAPAPAPAPGPRLGVAPDPLPGALGAAGLAALPVGGRVTSGFGVRADPFTGAPRAHDGVDVGAPAGTPIRVPADGVVRSAGPRGGYGNAVEIDHGGGVVTLYAHASELLVRPGEVVTAGQAIATVGSTGRSTGAHLHFEVRVAGRPVDPARALKVYAPRADDETGAAAERRRLP